LPFFIIFFAALFFCLGVRVRLKLTGAIDPATGFYEGGGLFVTAFNAVLAAAVILLFALYLLRDTERDYPVYGRERGLAVFSLLTGFSIILCQIEALRLFGTGAVNHGVALRGAPLYITGALGLLAAWSFVWLGGRGLFGCRGMYGAVIPLAAGIWQLAVLVSKFNGYSNVATVSDSLMAVLFTVFSAVFLVGHARTLSGLARRDGRNYAIPAGFCAALCGFITALPNWLWMLINRTRDIPAPLLGGFESFFIFCMSLYALCFVIKLTRSIRPV
jgi:hypothetical protein